MKEFILHIETAPLPMADLIIKAPSFKAASNLKDATKITEDIERKKNKYFEDAAYNEATGFVCATALLDTATGERELTHSFHMSEEGMLRKLYERLTKPYASTITFRGTKFIYPFIARRAAIYSDMNFFTNVFYKYRTAILEDETHTDLAKMWACGAISHPETIKEITDVLDIPLTQSVVPCHKLLTEERLAEAEDHLNLTLDTLMQVFTKLA